MTTFNNDDIYAAGMLGVAVGVVLGLVAGATTNGNRPMPPRFDESKLTTFEQSYIGLDGSWTTIYHAMYDDGKYTYEASDITRAAAIAAVRNMVLA